MAFAAVAFDNNYLKIRFILHFKAAVCNEKSSGYLACSSVNSNELELDEMLNFFEQDDWIPNDQGLMINQPTASGNLEFDNNPTPVAVPANRDFVPITENELES